MKKLKKLVYSDDREDPGGVVVTGWRTTNDCQYLPDGTVQTGFHQVNRPKGTFKTEAEYRKRSVP